MLTRALAWVVLLVIAAAAIAGERGFFGLALEVELDAGLALSPRLKEVRVEKVLTGSPAAQAGIAPGDLIVEVEGHKVAGARALELQGYLQRDVGQPLHLRVQRGTAEPFSVTLIATIGRPE